VFRVPSCGDVEKAQAEGCMGNVTPKKRKTEVRRRIESEEDT